LLTDPRMAIVNSLMQSGQDSSPLRSGWQEAARAMQGVVGALMYGKVQGDNSDAMGGLDAYMKADPQTQADMAAKNPRLAQIAGVMGMQTGMLRQKTQLEADAKLTEQGLSRQPDGSVAQIPGYGAGRAAIEGNIEGNKANAGVLAAVSKSLADKGLKFDPASGAISQIPGYAPSAAATEGTVTAANASAGVPAALTKSLADKGLQFDPVTGAISPIPGYAPSAAGTEGLIAGAKTTAKENAELPNRITTTRNGESATPTADILAPGSAPATAPATPTNNPLNMRVPGGTQFQSFASPDAAYAQAVKQLQIYQSRGQTTPYQMIAGIGTPDDPKNYKPGWAPPSDNNDINAYMRTLQANGINPNQPVDLSDPAQVTKLLSAMNLQESGKPADPAAIAKGITAASAPPTQVAQGGPVQSDAGPATGIVNIPGRRGIFNAGRPYGDSPEGRAIENMVATGKLSPAEADTYLGGHMENGPNGQRVFVSPQATLGAPESAAPSPDGSPAPAGPPQPAASTVGGQPPLPPGVKEVVPPQTPEDVRTHINEAQETVQNIQRTLDMLERAQKLSPSVAGGMAGKAEAFISREVGTGKTAAANTEFDALMKNQIASSLHAVFGSKITNGDRTFISQMEGSSDLSQPERDALINNAKALMQSRLDQEQATLQGLQGGKYFSEPLPQASGATPGARGAQPPAQGVPTFSSPTDPALLKLPSGSVFRDSNGVMRFKP
jgi:hypothetical protein